jgi:hypothetical protein
MSEPKSVLDTPIEPNGAQWEAPPYLSWDEGEVSGPYDNWKRTRLTVRLLTGLVKNLSKAQRCAFLKAVDDDGGLNWRALQTELETELRTSLGL